MDFNIPPDLSDSIALLKYENQRVLILLGRLVDNPDASDAAIARRARGVYVPVGLLRQWYVNYHMDGLERIITTLPAVPDDEFALIQKRLTWLMVDEWIDELRNPTFKRLNIDQISKDVAKRCGKSPRQCRRFIERWLAGGVLALSKSWNPVGGKKNNLLQSQSRPTLKTTEFQNDLCETILKFSGGGY